MLTVFRSGLHLEKSDRKQLFVCKCRGEYVFPDSRIKFHVVIEPELQRPALPFVVLSLNHSVDDPSEHILSETIVTPHYECPLNFFNQVKLLETEYFERRDEFVFAVGFCLNHPCLPTLHHFKFQQSIKPLSN